MVLKKLALAGEHAQKRDANRAQSGNADANGLCHVPQLLRPLLA
jgi:hypothetical protein